MAMKISNLIPGGNNGHLSIKTNPNELLKVRIINVLGYSLQSGVSRINNMPVVDITNTRSISIS